MLQIFWEYFLNFFFQKLQRNFLFELDLWEILHTFWQCLNLLAGIVSDSMLLAGLAVAIIGGAKRSLIWGTGQVLHVASSAPRCLHFLDVCSQVEESHVGVCRVGNVVAEIG